jgi:hypothetical protein
LSSSVRKVLGLVVTSAIAAGALLYFQGRFDAGDERSALALVQGYHSKGGRTLPDVIAELNPGSMPPIWSANTESACFQHERVRAEITTPKLDVLRYEFLVDINGPSIHPGNDNGHRALEALGP